MGEPKMQFELAVREPLWSGFFRMERYRLRHERFAGGWTEWIEREVFERGDAVAVLPYDPDADTVLLIEQFRPGALAHVDGPWLLEIPAGMLHADASPEQEARREAAEEAGLVVAELIPITTYFVSPGGTTERIFLFAGLGQLPAQGGLFGLAHEHEDIRTHVVPAEAAFTLVRAGKLPSAAPIIAVQWLELNRPRLRQEWCTAHRDF